MASRVAAASSAVFFAIASVFDRQVLDAREPHPAQVRGRERAGTGEAEVVALGRDGVDPVHVEAAEHRLQLRAPARLEDLVIEAALYVKHVSEAVVDGAFELE